MKQYRPIATIHNCEDIINHFPSADIKGDEANIIIKGYLSGAIEAKTLNCWDEEAFYTVEEAVEDKNFVLTSDGNYGVRFTRGDIGLLRKGSDQHGFYIDIYKTVDYKEKNIDMEENSAIDLQRLISMALVQPESNDTRIMVEKPDGELVPVSYVWYDRMQDIIRICYEEDEE
jgi:hypothetical protein